jgi:DNA-directed RNA polymerase specialized sigma24 family protein
MANHEELLREAVLVSRDLRRAQDEVNRLSAERRDLVQKLRDCGVSHGAIAVQLGVSRSAVQQLLRR